MIHYEIGGYGGRHVTINVPWMGGDSSVNRRSIEKSETNSVLVRVYTLTKENSACGTSPSYLSIRNEKFMRREQNVFTVIHKYISNPPPLRFCSKSTKRHAENQYALHIPFICLFRKISSRSRWLYP